MPEIAEPVSRGIWDNKVVQRLLAKIYHRLYLAHFEVQAGNWRKKYQIHPTVIWHPSTILRGVGSIIIGERSYIGANSYIESNPADKKVEIGRFCAIAPNVNIRTSGYRTDINFQDARLAFARERASIRIHDSVWIGANVFVCGGVEIGENSVIGANSVVTHDVPPHSICAGVPARVIRMKPELARTPSVATGTADAKPDMGDE